MPRADDICDFTLGNNTSPTDRNPLGVKGVGEAVTIGSTPCVVSAVLDALKPFGIRHLDMPLKPEKIWRAIRDARPRG